MAKKAKVSLNVLVVEGTRVSVKELAEGMECSQGEVVDRAVAVYRDSFGGAIRLVSQGGVEIRPDPVPEPDGLVGTISVENDEDGVSATVQVSGHQSSTEEIGLARQQLEIPKSKKTGEIITERRVYRDRKRVL